MMTDINYIDIFEQRKTIEEIQLKLFKIFKRHIGKQNAITPYQLFLEIFNKKKINIFFQSN